MSKWKKRREQRDKCFKQKYLDRMYVKLDYSGDVLMYKYNMTKYRYICINTGKPTLLTCQRKNGGMGHFTCWLVYLDFLNTSYR